MARQAEPKLNFSTQIKPATWELLQQYLAENPTASKTTVTDEAITEYILSRRAKQEGGN
ncbi:MAG: hypothetical protein A4E55_00377 [Pelotomaculum sp. PtaU1.Bin035]|nr:MAG: hypothetical protein A4E55_00377 [Pelotomaculum sp. PtaU1.Bin035]